MSIRVFFAGNKKVYADLGNFIVETDQPIAGGGEDTAPAPFELFLASLATCAGIYVKGYCDSRKLNAENIELIQNVEFDQATKLPKNITIEILVPEDFPKEHYDSIIKVASYCKVKKTISAQPNFEVVTKIK